MIVVFGSINVDVLVPVPRLPAAGETVLGSDYRIAPGGKGANQALAACRAGAEVVLVGAVGCDRFADIALEHLRADGVRLDHVKTADRPTGCAIITVDARGENQIAVASGANRTASAAQVPDLLLGPHTVVLLQRELEHKENIALIERARSRGARIVLNFAPADDLAPARFDDLDIIIANAHEAAALGDAPAALAQRLRSGLVVTRGAAGATMYLGDGTRLAVPALPVNAIDTTGAGDTFAGVFAAAWDQGAALADALRRASAAAALACRAIGAQASMPLRCDIDIAVTRLPARQR